MAAHAYWRVTLAPGYGVNYFQIYELTFRDKWGTDISIGGTASALSEYPGGYGPAKAFDKTSSIYSSNDGGLPGWLAYHFTSPVEVYSFDIWCTDASLVLPNSRDAYSLQYSDDGSSWTENGPLWYYGGALALSTVASFAAEKPLYEIAYRLRARENFRDLDFGGLGYIPVFTGIDDDPDQPVRRRVRLVRERDGICISELWTDADTGLGEFGSVDPSVSYSVIAYDHTGVDGAVIANGVYPEV